MAKRAADATMTVPDDLDAIRFSLHDDEALVLFGLTQREGVALVVERSEARVVTLPASATIRDAAAGLLADPRHVSQAEVRALRDLLVKPLALDEELRRVVISPMGRLGYVPFALLLPDHEVAYAPSATTYGLLREARDLRGEHVLALGDPDYVSFSDRQTVALRRGGQRFELSALPASRGEVDAVGTSKLLGGAASESRFRAAIKGEDRWRAVHFACHGLIDPEQPLVSSLALAADAESDGFLTALEILRMQIPADLVVLSACETGKGKIYETEGSVGLTRAFMFAGAPRVICSLWKVDDDATRALMVKFYELWEGADEIRGMGAAAALMEAQAYVRDHPDHPEWKDPYHWAAWVLWGLAE